MVFGSDGTTARIILSVCDWTHAQVEFNCSVGSGCHSNDLVYDCELNNPRAIEFGVIPQDLANHTAHVA